jgi:hypothetical protein
MSKTQANTTRAPSRSSQQHVRPSNRDSISSWLDVLTSMLVMSESQRTQVRDELEDHLRSRVDDLLIMGKDETQAIRVAVEELGETAELAKLITHAHTKSNPRRRTMNISMIAVALAGLSFGGFSFINSTAAPSQLPSGNNGFPVVLVDSSGKENEAVLQSEPEKPKQVRFDIESSSLQGILNKIASSFDREFEVSPRAKEHAGRRGNFFSIENSFIGEFTLDQAVDELTNLYPYLITDVQLSVGEDVLLIETNDEVQRRRIQNYVYPLPRWLHTADERRNYAFSIESLLKVKHDLQYTSIEVIGESIVIASPPEIQVEFEKMAAEMQAVVDAEQADRIRRQEERDRATQQYRVEQQKEHEIEMKAKKASKAEAIIEIKAEFTTVRSKLLAIKDQLRRVQNELNGDLRYELLTDDKAHRTKIQAQLNDMMIAKDLLEFEHNEIEEQYEYLRSRLFESQYANLFEDLE